MENNTTLFDTFVLPRMAVVEMLIHRYAPRPSLIDDLRQGVLIQLFLHVRQAMDATDFSAWTTTVVRREAFKLLTAEQRHAHCSLDEHLRSDSATTADDEGGSIDPADVVAAAATLFADDAERNAEECLATPTERGISQQMRSTDPGSSFCLTAYSHLPLLRALMGLPPTHREALLRSIDGEGYLLIAKEMGLSVRTVCRCITAAKQWLAHELSPLHHTQETTAMEEKTTAKEEGTTAKEEGTATMEKRKSTPLSTRNANPR